MAASSDSALVGRWRERRRPWYQTEAAHCAVCGCVLGSKVWLVREGEAELALCDPECEQLYRAYWRPRYGDRSQLRRIAERAD